MDAKILDDTTNAAVVQMPGRKFPGIVIQGDSLSILLSQVKDMKKSLKIKEYDELAEEIKDLYKNLADYLDHYEDVLAKNGMELPYFN